MSTDEPGVQPARRAGHARPAVETDTDEEPAGASGRHARQAPAEPAVTPQPTSRAGRDVRAATLVGVGLGAVLLASLFLFRPAFVALVAVAVGVACWELGAALRHGAVTIAVPPLLVASALLPGAAWLEGPTGLVLALAASVLLIAAWSLTEPARPLPDLLAAIFVLAYVPLLASFAVLLARPEDGAWRVLTFVLLVVCNDTGGFAAGVRFGRHPMAPSISPKKSWEGFAGSVVLAVAAGIVMVMVVFDGQWWEGLVLGAVAVVAATLGDFGESMIKRDLGIKDMSNLLPGHGGIMDRLDSLLVTAPVVWALLGVVLPA